MPAELSILFRYPCAIGSCTQYFKMKADYEHHQLHEHGIENEQAAALPLEEKMPEEIACTYQFCTEVFKTMNEMRNHKDSQADHFYCYTCDVDCKDWTDMVKHKVNSGDHITCPICGADFNSSGGLKMHAKQRHPRSQELPCPGCLEVFPNAAALVSHVETGRCRNEKNPAQSITKSKFRDNIDHKAVVGTLVEQLDYYSKYAGVGPTDQQVHEFSNVTSNDPAGWYDKDSSLNAAAWPDFTKPSNVPVGQLIDIDTASPWNHTTDAWNTTSNTWEKKVLFPGSNSQIGASKIKQAKNVHEKDASAAQVWPPQWANDTTEFKAQRFATNAAQKTGNRNFKVDTKFWDPKSSEYNPEIFYDDARQCYRCPHNSYTICFFSTTDARELTNHLTATDHQRTVLACPACNKLFKSQAGLVAHCESYSGKCSIRHLGNYADIMERLTGGLVKVQGRINKGTEPTTSEQNGKPSFDIENPVDRKNFLDEMHGDEASFKATERPIYG